MGDWGKRVRVTMTFVVAADEFSSMRPLLDGFEGAVRGLWPYLMGDIEPGGRVKLTQMRPAAAGTPKKIVAKEKKGKKQ